MSVTGGSLNRSGGSSGIPVPRVLIHPNGTASGSHDTVSVGWMTVSEYEELQSRQPEIWLFRYKTGYSPRRLPHIGSSYDNERGWRHPSDTLDGPRSGRSYSGGEHTLRSGRAPPPRRTEWPVTRESFYDAAFDPSLWFLDSGSVPYAWPISPQASSSFTDAGLVGQSGQGKNDTRSRMDTDPHHSRAASHLIGCQRQYFAFAFAVRDENDTRNRVVGALTPPIQCDIWPKVKTRYPACGTFADRGRKIKILQR